MIVPLLAAAMSPLLAWRDSVYIIAGLAGILAMGLLLLQPLLIGGYLPVKHPRYSRQFHRWVGTLLVIMVIAHVVALWFTSPPDVVDVLLFRSPTPFSICGVVAMWAVFLMGFLAAFRKNLRLSLRSWQKAHLALASITVVGTIVHALLIEGTMEQTTKIMLCILVGLATAIVLLGRLKTIKR